jgi:hypothetical protein
MTPTPSAPSELRRTLDDSLLVRHIATRMERCQGGQPARAVRAYMERRNFDVMGLLDGGRVSRYVARGGLTDDGTCEDHARPIGPTEIVSSTTPLIDFLPLMKQRDHLFVLEGARLESIVTAADLQKPPVRMLLFGLVSLLEMFLLALVRRHCSEGALDTALRPQRLEEARRLYDKRRSRNEEIDLADCLQICDKRDIILRLVPHPSLGFASRSSAERLFKDAEGLRNRLAHSQDLVLGTSWAEVIDLAEAIDGFLRRNEGMIEPSFSGDPPATADGVEADPV